MHILIKRNLSLYFRDVSDIILSVLSVFIAIGVYILFLSNLQIDMVNEAVKGIGISDKDVNWLVNSWVVSGLLAITPVTSSLGGLGTLVYDLDKKIRKDFKSSPVGDYKYPMSVLFSSCIIGTIMSLIPLVAYTIYIYITTGHLFTMKQYILSVLMICFTSFFSCSVMGFITTLLNSRQAFTSLSIIVGTLVGFLDGVYMPIGMLPNYMQTILKFIPFGNTAVVFRKILMENAIDDVMSKVPVEAQKVYLETYGIQYYFDGKPVALSASLVYISIWTIISFGAYIISYRYQRKKY